MKARPGVRARSAARATAIWAAVACSAGGAGADPPADLTPRAVVEAYLGNIDSFDRFTYRYTVTFAEAASVEAAVAGSYSAKPAPRTGQFILAKDGRNLSQKIVEDEQTTRQLDSPPKLESVPGMPNLMMGEAYPFQSWEGLSNSVETFGFTPRGATVNMRTGAQPSIMSHIPFGRQGSHHVDEDPAEHALGYLDRGTAQATVTQVTEGGRRLVKLTLDHTRDKSTAEAGVCEYWFDPGRAYLLVRFQQVCNNEARNVFRVEYSDPRPCPNGRWLPGRKLSLSQQFGRPRCMVWDIRCVGLEVDRRPDPKLFEVTMPAGTTVSAVDYGKPGGYFQTRRRETIRVEDLPRIYKMTHEAWQPRPAGQPMDTAIVPPRQPRRWWWIGGGAAAAVALVGFGWRVAARRRAAAGEA